MATIRYQPKAKAPANNGTNFWQKLRQAAQQVSKAVQNQRTKQIATFQRTPAQIAAATRQPGQTRAPNIPGVPAGVANQYANYQRKAAGYKPQPTQTQMPDTYRQAQERTRPAFKVQQPVSQQVNTGGRSRLQGYEWEKAYMPQISRYTWADTQGAKLYRGYGSPSQGLEPYNQFDVTADATTGIDTGGYNDYNGRGYGYGGWNDYGGGGGGGGYTYEPPKPEWWLNMLSWNINRPEGG